MKGQKVEVRVFEYRAVWHFKITNGSGEVIASGRGFVDENSALDAAEVSRKRVLGIRPRLPNTKHIRPAAATLVREWADKHYPAERKAA